MSALKASRPQPVYPCAQQELYTIVKIGWESYAEFLSRFEIRSTLYTAATGTDQLLALDVARNMPDEEQRDEVHATLRVQLIPLAEACMITWSDMSSYIRDGFPKNEYENKRMAAGYAHYAGAEHRNWDAVSGMMQDGLSFANANGPVLAAGGMPATFMPDYILVKDAFEAKHNSFLHAEEQAKMLTDQKILANNTLYENLTRMFEDGKKIFRDDAAVSEQFTFDRIWNLVSGPGKAGTGIPTTVVEIGVYVFDEETELPIEGAILIVLNTPNGVSVSVVTGADGTAQLRISGFEPKETVVLYGDVTVENYETGSGDIEVTAGNYYSLEVAMTRVV